MSALASQITDVSIVCSNVCSGADQWKHQSSASIAFVRGIHRWLPWIPLTKGQWRGIVSIWWRHYDATPSSGNINSSFNCPMLAENRLDKGIRCGEYVTTSRHTDLKLWLFKLKITRPVCAGLLNFHSKHSIVFMDVLGATPKQGLLNGRRGIWTPCVLNYCEET